MSQQRFAPDDVSHNAVSLDHNYVNRRRRLHICNVIHWQAIHLYTACHLAPSLYLSVYSPYMSENDCFVYIRICFQLCCAHAVIPRLTRAPLGPHTARTNRHWAWEKQPAKPDHSTLADFDCGIRYFIHVALCPG